MLIVGHQGVCYLVLEEKTLEESLMYGENSVIEPWALCHHQKQSKINWKLKLDNDKSAVRIPRRKGWSTDLLSPVMQCETQRRGK